jgi:hypothetical protein
MFSVILNWPSPKKFRVKNHPLILLVISSSPHYILFFKNPNNTGERIQASSLTPEKTWTLEKNKRLKSLVAIGRTQQLHRIFENLCVKSN